MIIRIILVVSFVFLNAQVIRADCKPLDDKKLEQLIISDHTPVRPGQTIRIRTYLRECCVIETDIKDLCVTWSSEPTAGVQLNPQTGEITVDNAVPAGTQFEVRADVQNGRRVFSSRVTVYTPEHNPFVGRYTEVSQLDCDTGKEFPPALPIKEIEFHADGRFFVTWMPFELYKDYWGTYTYDLKEGTFTVSDISGNYVPADIGSGGTFEFQSGSLLLKDFFFGSTPSTKDGETRKKACGHRLS
jgi:hypothetical protein